MNSWQTGGEANKNKPVVQFLAMVVKLEIITVNCVIFKVKIQWLRENSPYWRRKAWRGASLRPLLRAAATSRSLAHRHEPCTSQGVRVLGSL